MTVGMVTDVDFKIHCVVPPPPPPPTLPGVFQLVSLTQGGNTIGPPLATGTLVLTQTTYSIDLNVPDPNDPFGPPVNTVDSGTYSTSGSNWTQESSETGLQGVGTFTLQARSRPPLLK